MHQVSLFNTKKTKLIKVDQNLRATRPLAIDEITNALHCFN